MHRLSNLGARRAQQTLPEGPLEATVLTAPAASTDFVFVQVDTQPGQRRGPFPWVSNGRLPAPGDGALLIEGAGERWALVWATGPLITT